MAEHDDAERLRAAGRWSTTPAPWCLEGIVCKRVDWPYTSGRSRDWIKIKDALIGVKRYSGTAEIARTRCAVR